MWIGFLIFILGAAIGSFLNAAIFRTHEGEKVTRGRSKCMSCEEPISAKDLVPILSYFLLKKRCRKCKAVISWQYPAVEFVTGLLFLLFYMKYSTGFSLEYPLGIQFAFGSLIRDWVFISYLVILFVYDLRYMFILDRFTIPAMIFALLVNLWLGLNPISLLIGGAVLGGFFLLQHLISRGTWVGGGDIRMGVLMGFMLGLQNGLVAMFFAYLIGAIVGVGLLVTGKAKRRTAIPFGTFLALGTLIVLFAGELIVDWYLSLFLI